MPIYKRKDYISEYQALGNAILRCSNKNHAQWKDYGGRGVKVDPLFTGPDGFDNFMEAVGRKPSPELTLDRVSNEKGYEVGNLAWTTRSAQQRNQRPRAAKVTDLGWGLKAHIITRGNQRVCTVYSPIVPLGDRKLSLREWSIELGVNPRTLKQRIQRGMKPAEALVPMLFTTRGAPRKGPTIH